MKAAAPCTVQIACESLLWLSASSSFVVRPLLAKLSLSLLLQSTHQAPAQKLAPISLCPKRKRVAPVTQPQRVYNGKRATRPSTFAQHRHSTAWTTVLVSHIHIQSCICYWLINSHFLTTWCGTTSLVDNFTYKSENRLLQAFATAEVDNSKPFCCVS